MEKERKAVFEILNSNDWHKMESEIVHRIAKSNTVSSNTRHLGNARYKENDHDSGSHENIIQLYSLAIATANSNSEELAVAYNNRSAMMLHLWMYKACVVDIQRAMSITKDKLLKIKLLCRKAKCLNALGMSGRKVCMQEAETLFDEVKNDRLGKTLANLVTKTKLSLDEKIIFKNLSVRSSKKSLCVEELHQKYKVNDFSLIGIRCNEKYGRHLVAKKDIHPGEIIFIEKPYLHCLDLGRGHAYCFHCLTPCLINIPCDNCSWAMYCSNKCKETAWKKYHIVECTVYAYAKETVDGDIVKHLALKSFIFGIRQAGGIAELKDELEVFDRCSDKLKGFEKDGKIQTQGFKSIYALVSNTADKYENHHRKNTRKILRSIAKHTTFFGKTPSYENTKTFKEDDNVLFVASLIYRLSKIVHLNNRTVPSGRDFCTNGLDPRICENKHCCTAGIYIAPIISLLNHSCIPNVKTCFSSNYSVIVYAVQPIKKGSQLFDCYQQEFSEFNEIPRRKFLTKMYNFQCDCAACKNKWDLVEYEVISKRILKQNRTEFKLVEEYLPLIKSILGKKIELNEKHIDSLTKGLKKANEKLSQPSFIITNLTRALNVVFKNLYGSEISIPDDCNKV